MVSFLYKVRTKLRIKITQHDDTYFNVLIQRKHRKTKKTSFLKKTVKNADLNKAVLNKTMTTQEQCVKHNFVAPLSAQNNFYIILSSYVEGHVQKTSSLNLMSSVDFQACKIWMFFGRNFCGAILEIIFSQK